MLSSLLFGVLSNVVVVWIDDISRSDWDGIDLPNLHALEASGVTFPRAYAQPYCSPARLAGQFGEYGFRHNVGWIIKKTDPNAPAVGSVTSLAQVFKAEGYSTLHAGKWHLSSEAQMGIIPFLTAPNQFGYDDALAWSHGNTDADGGNGHFDWTRYDNGVKTPNETTYTTTAIIDSARTWWAATSGPKFANIAFNTPHVPHQTPPAGLIPSGYPTPATDRDKYEAALRGIGVELGRFLEVVDLSSTFVIVLGDNGTPGSVAANPGQVKGSIYQDGIQVPFFVFGNGVTSRASRNLIHAVDLQATLIDLLGFNQTAHADGVSFAAAILNNGPAPVREWVYCERGKPNGPQPWNTWNRTIVHRDGYKLTVREFMGVENEQLWMLPDETTPVVNPVKAAQLRAIMDGVTQ